MVPEHDDLVYCRERIVISNELASRLLELASRSRERCHHDGCRLLNGVIRDCGLKIINLTERWSRGPVLGAAREEEAADQAVVAAAAPPVDGKQSEY